MKTKRDTLKALRLAVLNIGQTFEEILGAAEEEDEMTKIEKMYCFFLWEIDEELRRLHKLEEAP